MQVLTEVDSAVQEKRKDIKEVIIMENRMVKFYSKESNMVAIHAIPGILQQATRTSTIMWM